jgi:hypothetical protein
MFNLKERHIVVVLVLIAVIFLLFLSTRTPMCITEGLNLNEYNSMYKVENHNLNDSIINDSSYSNNNGLVNDIETSKIIDESEKEVKPIVLSKNQIHEYTMDEAEVLEEKYNLKHENIKSNEVKNLNKIKNNTVLLTKKQHKLKKIEKNPKFKDSYNNENLTPTSSASRDDKEYIEDVNSDNYDLSHSNTYIHENQYNLIENKYSEISDNDNMISEVNDNLDNKLKEIQTSEYHEESVPMGYSNYDFNAFGLLREEIPSVKKINYKSSNNLDKAKCSTLRSAVLDLNKSGFITNNKVESSWNDTFKETCGNW